MVEEQKTSGLFRDLIIHPGETLAEILEDREMTQKELSIRAGVTEKHISTIIKGKNNISVAFAKKLEYALGIEASFWINLQANYDKELLEYEEVNQITEEEISVLQPLKQIVEYFEEIHWLKENDNKANRVIDLRKILGVSNLTAIPNITYNAAYRAQLSTNINVDAYVLYAWQRICELLTMNIDISEEINIDLLKDSIPEIKRLMFKYPNEIQKKLTDIFAKCGIAFRVVKHFRGAPVQGFIKCNEQGRMILCMTLRKARADIFWFTLFHEIGHIIYGDVKQKFIDFDSVKGDIEVRADVFARDTLMDPVEYKKFVVASDFTLGGIRRFAKEQGVQNFVVIGRLQLDGRIGWEQFNKEVLYYKWAE